MTSIATINVYATGDIHALDGNGQPIPDYVGRRRDLLEKVLADAPMNAKWYLVGVRGGRKRTRRPTGKAHPFKYRNGTVEPPTRAGRILLALMMRSKMSSVDFSNATGIARSHIANILGGFRPVTPATVRKVCHAFDLNQQERLELSNAAAQDCGFNVELQGE